MTALSIGEMRNPKRSWLCKRAFIGGRPKNGRCHYRSRHNTFLNSHSSPLAVGRPVSHSFSCPRRHYSYNLYQYVYIMFVVIIYYLHSYIHVLSLNIFAENNSTCSVTFQYKAKDQPLICQGNEQYVVSRD